MAFKEGHDFAQGASAHRKRQMSTLVEKEGHFGPALTVSCRLLPRLHFFVFGGVSTEFGTPPGACELCIYKARCPTS